MSIRDGLRLAVGTLTVVRVPPPRSVDRSSASWAMTFAPLVGLLLAAGATIVLWLLGWSPFGGAPFFYDVISDLDLVSIRPAPSWVASALTIGGLALFTRGMHLDGLADTADGLGSGNPAEQALAVMRKSDIGPFGVVTVMLVLLTQVAALAALTSIGRGPFAVAFALVVSRFVLPLACSRGIPAARPGGLGQAVAGTVSRVRLLVAAALGAAGLLGLFVLTLGVDLDLGRAVLAGVVTAVIALVAGAGLCWRCVRRFGGVTGDVLGACVEVTFTVALVVLTML